MTEITNTRTLETVAAEIRTFTASMLNNIIEIGRRLCEAKELLPHGDFGDWVKENTGYSKSTANNFMRLFLEYGSAQGSLFGAEVSNVQTFGKLSYSKALALLAVPAEEREEFVETHPVEDMSTRELAEAIRERDEARARVRELESRPVEVAVQEPDPAELQKRIDDAVREQKAKAKKERDRLREKLDAAKQAEKDLTVAAEKAKQEAEEAAKKLEEVRAAAIDPEEKTRLEREAEELRKKVAMSNENVVTFRAHFTAAQRELNDMHEAMSHIMDTDTRMKMLAAARKLLAIWGEKWKPAEEEENL